MTSFKGRIPKPRTYKSDKKKKYKELLNMGESPSVFAKEQSGKDYNLKRAETAGTVPTSPPFNHEGESIKGVRV